MTPERARKIAQACADTWYGGAACLNLKEAIAQGIMEACNEIEGDLVATRHERDVARANLAAARARNKECDLLLSRVLHELAGSASLCWEPKPTGVFATELALGFVEDAIKELRAVLAEEKK